MEIHMTESQVSVGNGPEGSKLLQISDLPSGIKVMVVLPAESARKIAGALTGIHLASALPGNGRGEDHG